MPEIHKQMSAASPMSIRLQQQDTSTAALVTTSVVRGNIEPGARAKDVEKAVYAYIQAVRTLGRTRMNTVEISEALKLPGRVVESTITSLRKKGVKAFGG